MRTKYNYDPETYDHTDVASRPIILFQGYTKNRVPFLTVIRMWDEACDFLLSSKHDPLTIGSGEIGFDEGTTTEDLQTASVTSSPDKVRRKRKNTLSDNSKGGNTDLSSMLSTVVKTCESLNSSSLNSPITNTIAAKIMS